MRIKICGLFREQDIEYINEALPNYAGFVFAESKRQVSAALAKTLRSRLAESIVPVGVFVNAPIAEIAALYNDGVISAAQLHGDEDEKYIAQLKAHNVTVIKVIKTCSPSFIASASSESASDYFLVDSGAGSGKTFDWEILNSVKFTKPWFLAGGINLDNIEQAISLQDTGLAPFAIDISSGAESDGIKDREKILKLTAMVRKGSVK